MSTRARVSGTCWNQGTEPLTSKTPTQGARNERTAAAESARSPARAMAWSNFIVTVGGILAVASLMRTDVRHSSAMLRRNMKQIRKWVEDGTASSVKEASKSAEKTLGETPVGKAIKDMREEQLKGKK